MSAVMEKRATELPFAATTPIHVARVGLRSGDAEQLAEFYKALLGLEETGRGADSVSLGVAGRELLEIEGSQALKPDNPRSAGLYHTAFLLPSRKDLARWVGYATENGIRLDGASDHLVSEALYLTDPDGNGIEIYADRAKEKWPSADGQIQMATEPLDFRGLLGELSGDDIGWKGAPVGSVIGHVHLRVGDIAVAEAWWNDTIGLDTMVHYGNAAVFLSSGGYHHHIGANVWQSRGAASRSPDTSGLNFVELASAHAKDRREVMDPWGTAVRISPAT